MALKIAVCDDILSDMQHLVALIKKYNSYCECYTYRSGELLLWDFDNGTRFDIYFLDIFMEGITGLDVAKHIRVADPYALLIFVSSSNDYYRESYDLYAFNYLIKPLTHDKVTQVLQHSILHLDKDMDQVVQFSFNNTFHTVRCSQILYLSSDKHIVFFHLLNGEALKSYGKMDDFLPLLPADVFVRCHQSYIVNLKHVTSMTIGEFMLKEVIIPISRKYCLQAREKYRIDMFGDF